MKRTLIGLFLVALVFTGQAQGLNKIIVEKYYVSDANDSVISGGTLPVGSVTWRIYVDMKPGYLFQTATGDKNHSLVFSTTTSFYNNADGDNNPNGITTANAKTGTVMLDSWLSTGAASKNFWGVLKSEDSTAGNFVNADGALINIDTSAGPALTVVDGMRLKGTVPAFGTLGIPQNTLDILGDGTVSGNIFSIDNGAWYILGGTSGPNTTNRVLIAQLTTDGTFHYELNFQLGKDLGGGLSLTEKYASTNPQSDEMSGAQYHLSGTLAPMASILTIGLTGPADASTFVEGDVVHIMASAAESYGSITKVEFFVNDTKVGQSTSAPFKYDWTSVAGDAAITAVATDFAGNMRTSDPVNITVGTNELPTVSITSPVSGSSAHVGDSITITATAADADGTIASVQFFVDDTVSLGVVTTAPYKVKYEAAAGSHSLTAKATDNKGGKTTSDPVTIDVVTGIANISSGGTMLKVYPNPASDVVTLEISASGQNKKISYRIINVIGQVMMNKTIGSVSDKYLESINISSLPMGLYTIAVSMDDKTYTQRIIKQ
jgi:hypothetical protein